MKAKDFVSYFKNKKLKPDQWESFLEILVMDPDGWDRKGDFDKDWNKKITLREFLYKSSYSTCQYSLFLKDVAELLRTDK
jgi:hypothetical protein